MTTLVKSHLKRIVLCADDYGQDQTISQGIRHLIEKNRLTAVSCMVNTNYWEEEGNKLRIYSNLIDAGLHLNLTEGKACSALFKSHYGQCLPNLKTLLCKAYLRRLDQRVIEAELLAQLDRFEAIWGGLPGFIDGHQHIHQFPIIRAALINIYESKLKRVRTYIRNIKQKHHLTDYFLNPKKYLIQALGSKSLNHLLRKHDIPHNQSFAGIYRFKEAADYRQKFKKFCNEINDMGLIMSHPGLLSSNDFDPIAKTRYQEYQYLVSDQFLEDCQKFHWSLSRFSAS